MMAPISIIASILLSFLPFITLASQTYNPNGPILNATDYAQWITKTAAQGETTLILQPGVYNVSSPLPSMRSHLDMPQGLSNLLLECTGVTLLLENRRGGAVYLSNWTNVTFRGLVIRYAMPPSNAAIVTNVNASVPSTPQIDVIVDDGYPTDDFENGVATSCDVYDPITRLQKIATWDIPIVHTEPLPSSVASAQPQFRLTLGNIGQLLGVNVGDVLGCRVSNGQMTFHVDGAESCLFQDIILFGGPAFGFFHTGTPQAGMRGGNTFRNISIRYPSPPPGASSSSSFPPLSTSADGFHCALVSQGPIIENSFFEGMNDDGIAIHGSFNVVTGANMSENTIVVASRYGGNMYMVGEAIALYNQSFAPIPTPQPPVYEKITFTITNVQPAPKGYLPPFNTSHTMPSQNLTSSTYVVLTLASPIPNTVGFDFVVSNANRTGNGFQILNTTIQNHRARGMLIKASHGLIQGNTIINSSLGGIIITPELYWGEADFAHDLLVENNTINGVARARQGYGGIALGAVAPNNQPASGPGGHGNITLRNNVLIDVGYAPVWITSSANVTFTNNTILTPFHASPASNTLPTCCEPVPNFIAVWVSETQDFTASGNCVQPASDGENSLQYLYNTTDSVTGENYIDGVTLC